MVLDDCAIKQSRVTGRGNQRTAKQLDTDRRRLGAVAAHCRVIVVVAVVTEEQVVGTVAADQVILRPAKIGVGPEGDETTVDGVGASVEHRVLHEDDAFLPWRVAAPYHLVDFDPQWFGFAAEKGVLVGVGVVKNRPEQLVAPYGRVTSAIEGRPLRYRPIEVGLVGVVGKTVRVQRIDAVIRIEHRMCVE